MNEKQKDKGLMKAVKEQPQFRLTSNFTFRTMQKVEEAILLRERKQERKMLLATIAARENQAESNGHRWGKQIFFILVDY